MHVKEEKKSAARVSAVQEMLRWHRPRADWTVLPEGEAIHTARTHSTSKFKVSVLVREKRGEGISSSNFFLSPGYEIPSPCTFQRFLRMGRAEGREDSLLLPYLPSLYVLSLFHHGLGFCWMTWTGSPIHAISECLREGALSQSQSRGWVETSIFWRR